jgi:hypothetical protein
MLEINLKISKNNKIQACKNESKKISVALFKGDFSFWGEMIIAIIS